MICDSRDKVKDRFFYNGKIVRYFKDQESAENTNSFFFGDGVVDVEPIRNASGILTGLKQSSDADFNAKTEKHEEMKVEFEKVGIDANSSCCELGDPNYCDDSLYCDSSANDGINLKVIRDKNHNIEKLVKMEE